MAVALALGASSAAAAGTTLYVSPTGLAGKADTSCSKAAYSSIQSAVNAAGSGYTVVVCAGTYHEQVTVSTSNLTIKGSGTSSMIDPTTGSPTSVSDLDSGQPIVAIVDVTAGTTGTNLMHLVADGSGLSPSFGDCSKDFVGILYQGASGMLSASTARNIALPSGLGGCQDGLAVFVQAGPSGTANVSMRNVTVSSYDKNGVTCVDAGTTCSLNQITATGAGPSSTVGAQNGVQIGPGASGNVSHLRASGDNWTGGTNSTEPQADYASGLLLYGAGGTTPVNLSTLADDQIGIEIVDSNASLLHTKITQSGAGIAGSVGVFDVPCDLYCSFLGLSPGSTTLSAGDTQISYSGSPSGSYGIWVGDSWSGNDPWGSAGTVTYHVRTSVISGAANPTVYGPRAQAG